MEDHLRKSLVYNKESIYLVLILLFSISTYLFLLLSIIGIIFIIIIGLISYFFHALSMAHIRRNSVRLSPSQFPGVYEKASALARNMELESVPSIYVMESYGILNAFASRFFGKDMVVIYSDIFDLIESDREDELMYVLAHEFAHVKRRHVLLHFLILPAMWIPFLGDAYLRACEYTCDRYAVFYTNNMNAAQNALTTLAIGKKLQHRVNKEAFILQLEEEKGFFAWLNEKLSTHPHLPKRMNAINNWQNPENHKLFKERKRNLLFVFIFVFVSIALISSSFYLMDKIFTYLDEQLAEEAFLEEGYEEDYELKGLTPLMIAASESELATMSKLINEEGDIDAVDENGTTALQWAVFYRQYDAAKLLIESGSDIDIADDYGDTSLLTATQNEDTKMVKLLLSYGADKSIENSEGYIAEEYALEYGDDKTAELLAD